MACLPRAEKHAKTPQCPATCLPVQARGITYLESAFSQSYSISHTFVGNGLNNQHLHLHLTPFLQSCEGIIIPYTMMCKRFGRIEVRTSYRITSRQNHQIASFLLLHFSLSRYCSHCGVQITSIGGFVSNHTSSLLWPDNRINRQVSLLSDLNKSCSITKTTQDQYGSYPFVIY